MKRKDSNIIPFQLFRDNERNYDEIRDNYLNSYIQSILLEIRRLRDERRGENREINERLEELEKMITLLKDSLSDLRPTIVEYLLKLVLPYLKYLSPNFWRSTLRRMRMLLTAPEVDEFGYDEVFESFFKPVISFLYYKYWRVQTEGLENIPSEGPVLIVANHSGTLPWDGAITKYAIKFDHPSGRDVRFLAEDFVYHFPWLGSLLIRIGGVRASQENADLLLEKKMGVIVFPEGVKGIGKLFKHRYKLQRFGRGGVVRTAIKNRVPVVPVAIVGAEEIHPLLFKAQFLAKPLGLPYFPITPTFPLLGPFGLIPLPTKWYIRFGKPIDFSTYSPSSLQNNLLINRANERIRKTIQNMIIDILKKRRSIFTG